MELAKRLASLATFVPPGSIAADIGTDHAYLPIFLVEKGICPVVIATDIKDGPFRSASCKVKEHNLEGKVILRQGDGLKALEPLEADVLVLAGMGGNTIREILSASPHILCWTKRLVIQPMADAAGLRFWLAANGWKIADELLIEEDGRIYLIITAEQGLEETADPIHLELGPRLLEKKDPLMKAYLEKIVMKYERVLSGLSAATSKAAHEKAVNLKRKVAKIKEVAKYL
ncbi:MAG: tRNA (adenine(22)-N(1))-methyltransferase [Pelotomaculum sp. PtaU1.Bin035]|nr:MAG: tRNA (adenine(22)-N(1))-methyltransferase [Pelotomaculum sp. PtaU1.Bin035]